MSVEAQSAAAGARGGKTLHVPFSSLFFWKTHRAVNYLH